MFFTGKHMMDNCGLPDGLRLVATELDFAILEDLGYPVPEIRSESGAIVAALALAAIARRRAGSSLGAAQRGRGATRRPSAG